MKLATLRTTARDGELLVVSRDLSRAVFARAVVPTLQAALDAWDVTAPRLQALADALEQGKASGVFDLDLKALAAPLPRPYGWIDSSVYLNHMELARRLRGVPMPEIFRREPLLSARVSAPFLAPFDPIALPPGDFGLDIEGEIAVILDDVPHGAAPEEAARHIRLVTLVNDSSYRTVYARDAANGKPTFHGKSIPSMAPIAATPDELGDAWDGGKLSLPIECRINDTLLGRPDAGVDMQFTFPEIIASAVSLRGLGSGTVLGCGTISNRDNSVGTACIAEKRMIETAASGAPVTRYLAPGDTVRIEMFDRTGRTIFGPIRHEIVAGKA